MKAKFVNDILNEKFTEKSDPIVDMGIGSFATLRQGDIIECIKFVQTSQVWHPSWSKEPVHKGETLYNTPRQNWLGNLFEPGEKYRLFNPEGVAWNLKKGYKLCLAEKSNIDKLVILSLSGIIFVFGMIFINTIDLLINFI